VCAEVFATFTLPRRFSDALGLIRYQGGAKQGGPQYPQAVAVGSNLHVIFSVNKEARSALVCLQRLVPVNIERNSLTGRVDCDAADERIVGC
jgi:hypothetical protein